MKAPSGGREGGVRVVLGGQLIVSVFPLNAGGLVDE